LLGASALEGEGVGMIVMGIDPGISGAVAFFFPMVPERVSVDDVPAAGGEINTSELARLIKIHRPSIAVLEKVGAMPGQQGMFNFGRSVGAVMGVVGALDIPLHLVSPQKWKKHFGLSADKEQCRLRAIRMFPAHAERFKFKKHHDRAEAALIALYGAQVLLKVTA
jgi:crossover junction endodeoxyribonuclease RuvC